MSDENQQQSPQYTEEEMKQMRERMTKFYKDEIKHLQPQAQYYKLLAEIEESKLRRFSAMAQGAHMHAQAEAAEKEALENEAAEKEAADKPEPKTEKRSLKKD